MIPMNQQPASFGARTFKNVQIEVGIRNLNNVPRHVGVDAILGKFVCREVKLESPNVLVVAERHDIVNGAPDISLRDRHGVGDRAESVVGDLGTAKLRRPQQGSPGAYLPQRRMRTAAVKHSPCRAQHPALVVLPLPERDTQHKRQLV